MSAAALRSGLARRASANCIGFGWSFDIARRWVPRPQVAVGAAVGVAVCVARGKKIQAADIVKRGILFFFHPRDSSR
jgi:hypothetical protein